MSNSNLEKYNNLRSKRRYKTDTPLRTTICTSDAASHFRGDSIEADPASARDFAEFVSQQMGFDVPIGHQDREVYITPFPGHYGLSGYVITVNGSPTCATLIVNLSPWINVSANVDGRTTNWGVRDTIIGKRRIDYVVQFLKSLGLEIETNKPVRPALLQT
jgi:hypothetical protein